MLKIYSKFNKFKLFYREHFSTIKKYQKTCEILKLEVHDKHEFYKENLKETYKKVLFDFFNEIKEENLYFYKEMKGNYFKKTSLVKIKIDENYQNLFNIKNLSALLLENNNKLLGIFRKKYYWDVEEFDSDSENSNDSDISDNEEHEYS